jgi:hypothetical protein
VYHILGFLLCAVLLNTGCSPNQTVKNTWKGTKNLWYSYVNTPAEIDYDDAGKMPEYETRFAGAMMGADLQLRALERAMQNADKPPTPEWLNAFFTQFPWVHGIIGLNGEGGVVGQAGEEKDYLDFGPLLEQDPKQNLRDLRGYVQDTAHGPELMLGVPLYDGADFLGVVVAYFDMPSLMRYSDNAEELVVSSPAGLLWPGRYGEGSSLEGRDWEKIVRGQSGGSVSGGSGTFIWISRFLGNYPLIFATLKSDPKSPPPAAKEEGEEKKGSGERPDGGTPAADEGRPPRGEAESRQATTP